MNPREKDGIRLDKTKLLRCMIRADVVLGELKKEKVRNYKHLTSATEVLFSAVAAGGEGLSDIKELKALLDQTPLEDFEMRAEYYPYEEYEHFCLPFLSIYVISREFGESLLECYERQKKEQKAEHENRQYSSDECSDDEEDKNNEESSKQQDTCKDEDTRKYEDACKYEDVSKDEDTLKDEDTRIEEDTHKQEEVYKEEDVRNKEDTQKEEDITESSKEEGDHNKEGFHGIGIMKEKVKDEKWSKEEKECNKYISNKEDRHHEEDSCQEKVLTEEADYKIVDIKDESGDEDGDYDKEGFRGVFSYPWDKYLKEKVKEVNRYVKKKRLESEKKSFKDKEKEIENTENPKMVKTLPTSSSSVERSSGSALTPSQSTSTSIPSSSTVYKLPFGSLVNDDVKVLAPKEQEVTPLPASDSVVFLNRAGEQIPNMQDSAVILEEALLPPSNPARDGIDEDEKDGIKEQESIIQNDSRLSRERDLRIIAFSESVSSNETSSWSSGQGNDSVSSNEIYRKIIAFSLWQLNGKKDIVSSNETYLNRSAVGTMIGNNESVSSKETNFHNPGYYAECESDPIGLRKRHRKAGLVNIVG